MCGGTPSRSSVSPWPPGLSPRVRGNLPRPIGAYRITRSIPACAGEPALARRRYGRPTVYPRVCGGTSMNTVYHDGTRGLSPRVRGNHVVNPSVLSRVGSIPACAGEPRRRTASPRLAEVYPRVCGGTSLATFRNVSANGLSPRVRGNHHRRAVHVLTQRSIPACAGEPLARRTRSMDTRVYPRVCGGTCPSNQNETATKGLSPRVRGNLRHPRQHPSRPRSIPACAGEPPDLKSGHVPSEVYPRVCGGTVVCRCSSTNPPGLSPRVRGNRGVAAD